MPRLWLIDDTPAMHRVADATGAMVDGWDFDGHLNGADAVAAFEHLGDGIPPDVILMDFYLGDDRGDHVTARLRQRETAHHRPVIVGYSSVRSGSAAILAAGGDLILPKHENSDGINPSLLAYLRGWPR